MTDTSQTSGERLWHATVTPQARSSVKIEGEIPYAVLATYRSTALAALGKNASLAGFRKGHIPEKVLIERLGEMTILNEMAERALARAYPEILREHAIDAIGRPHITLTKLAPDNPLGFCALVAVVPTVTLPDYKKIAAAIAQESAEVGDTELDDAIADIARQKTAYERMQKKAAAKRDAENAGLSLPTPETGAPEEVDESDAPPPPLSDEYVKTLGDFASVDDFKTKLRAHLAVQKAHDVAAKHRAAITDRIVELTPIDLPRVLIEAEIRQMFGQMEHDLTRANLSLDDYLTHLKKTKDELAAEWTPAAEKRAKLQLILNAIAQAEGITAPAEQVEKESARLRAQYTDADPTGVRLYITSLLQNEAVLSMLTKQPAPAV